MDVVWFVVCDYSVEVVVYEDFQVYEICYEKESIRGCYLEYFGFFFFKIKFVVDGVIYIRIVLLIFMEFFNGLIIMKELIDSKQVFVLDDVCVYLYVCVVKLYLKFKIVGIL